jgi:anti-anti-sigma factor
MSIHIERDGDVAIVMPKGMLRGGKDVEELERDLRKLVYDDQKKIILDLKHTTHMNSTGIGVLASVHTSAVNRGVTLHVCNIERRIEHVLTIVKLTRVLNCFDTRKEALAAFED